MDAREDEVVDEQVPDDRADHGSDDRERDRCRHTVTGFAMYVTNGPHRSSCVTESTPTSGSPTSSTTTRTWYGGRFFACDHFPHAEHR
jgi:hypothetical protein